MQEKFTFGIDHPLVTVKDHKRLLQNYQKMGFMLSPVSYHPWGTATALVMFGTNFIELIGMDDPSKIGSPHKFCFGRYIHEFLTNDEGVSLLALHSKDIEQDFAQLSSRLTTQGRIDFRRKIIIDGQSDEAVVSLAMFLDGENAGLSNFLCQQHKPELIWVPAWQKHPNTAKAIADITYVGDVANIVMRWQQIYGDVIWVDDEWAVVDTHCGTLTAMSKNKFEHVYPMLTLPNRATAVFAAMISVLVDDMMVVEQLLQDSHISYTSGNNLVVHANEAGNVLLRFVDKNS